MLILGLDPSLTNFGWSTTDTTTGSCVERGRFQTSASTVYIDRYVSLRDSLVALIQRTQPDAMGLEFPVFGEMYSEGMYGLFLYCSEALRAERQNVVFWSPLQIKQYARDLIVRPPKWKMDKADMVEAAQQASGDVGRWNHNEADAYLCASLSGRFWLLQAGVLAADQLTDTERKLFVTGTAKKPGVAAREDDRYFQWAAK